MSGIDEEVGGSSLKTSSTNTLMASELSIERVIFSPASEAQNNNIRAYSTGLTVTHTCSERIGNIENLRLRIHKKVFK